MKFLRTLIVLIAIIIAGAATGYATPVITSVSPNPVPASSGSQTFTINGSGFISGATTVTLRSPFQTYPNQATTSIVSNQIVMPVSLGTTAAQWTVEVIVNGVSSGQVSFQVGSVIPPTPTNPSPGSLSSPGPTTASSSVTLSWSASSGTTTYGVGVRDMSTNVLVVDTTVSATSFTANLSGGKPYRWNVDACNSAGCSSFTTVLYFQTPSAVSIPATPTNTSPGSLSSPGPTTASSSVTLGWTASSGATTYGVGVRDMSTNVLVVDTNTSGTSYTANLSDGKPYRWNVDACNSAGCSSFTTVLYFQTPTTATIPGAPQSLAASGGNGLNGLAWNAPSSNGGATITSYRVFRGTNSSNRQIVSSGGCGNLGAGLGCTDTGLTNGQSYDYIVAAVNSAGQGPPSNSATATPMSSTPTISSVSPNPVPASSGSQTFTINGSGFISGATTVTLRSPSQTYPNQATTSVSTNQILMPVSLGTTAAQWTVEAIVSGVSSGLFPFQVGAGSIPATPTNPSPGSLSSPGSTTGSTSVTLSWSASSGATTYGVGVRDMSTNVLVVDTNASGTSFTASLSAGKPYRWNVDACNSAGCSSFTTVLYFQTPPGGATLPGAPQSLAASGGNGQNGLGWNAPSSNGGATITSYRVFRGTNSSNTFIVTSGGCANLGAVGGCTDTGLTNGQSYYYIVSAVNSVGQGAPSNSATATPTGAVSAPTITGYTWNTSLTDHQNFSGTITGTGFISGIRVFFCVNGSTTCYEHPQAGVLLNNSNNLSLSNVNLGAGSYQLLVQTSGGASARSTAFTVNSTTAQAVVVVSPTSGPLGTAFSFSGSNFTRNSGVTLSVTRPNGTSGGSGRYSTDSNGSVFLTVTSQPTDPTGQWAFVLTDDSGKAASRSAQYTATQQSGTDVMSFIADVNFPDNSQITAGSNFTKIWRLKNLGTTTWTNYTAVFISNPTNGNPSTNLNASGATSVSVPPTSPNQTVDLSISMKALSPGTYYSYWQLQNASGGPFGVQFYVKIRVVAKQGIALGYGTQSGKSGTNDSLTAKFATNSDPVNTATGNYNYAATDLRVPGRGLDVEISRSYNSQDPTVGTLGNGWSHSFNIYLADISATSATVHYSDGKVLDYINQPGTGNFTSSYPGFYDTLVKNSDGTWILKKTDQKNYRFDAAGKLTAIQDRNNNQISLSYSGGNLVQVTDTVGRTFTFTYAGALLTGITDPAGRNLQFSYDGSSNLILFRDANGNTNSYQYDANNQLTKVVDGRGNNLVVNTYTTSCPMGVASCVGTQANGRGNQWTFTYNSDGSTSVLDPFNKPSKYLQDTNFNIQQTQDRNANTQFASGPVNVHYDESNNRDQTSDANGNPFAYVHDQNGNITSRTDPTLNSRQVTYDSNNNPRQITDELGKTTQIAYDPNGNPITLTDALNNVSATTYDSFGEPLTVTDANGNVTTRMYDAQGNMTSVKDVLNSTTTYAYDSVGRRTSMTDARGKTTRYTYDANDNLLTVTDPLNNVTTYTYDANNNRLSMRDARGNTTTYAYDENNSLIKETDAKGSFIQHTYDKLDRRISTRDKKGNVTNFAYDNEGRPMTVTDPVGNATSYSYDANGNRTKVTDAKGQSTLFTYDAMNRVTRIQDSLGNSIQKEYDQAGRLAKETDPRGNATQFTYDDIGNLRQVTDAAAGTATYTYDKNRNRITQTDPNAHTSNLAYDKLNRLLSAKDPLTHVSSYTYDEVGNRASQTDANGKTTRYAYDDDNRLSVITYSDNSTVQFTRDANGNVMQMADSLGTSSYVYDELNRLTSYTDPFGKAIGYQYDENGNITKLSYPDGKQVSYQFDANNRMSSLSDWAGKATSFQYDATNVLTTVTYPNGIVTSMTYDNAGRLIAKSDLGISSYSFTLDKNGNRTLASISQPARNRPQNASQNYSHDAANQIQSAGNATFGFDNNGNMTSKTENGATTNYGYDFEDRLVSVSGSSQYFYDGQGVRLQKSEGAKTTRYVVDTNHDLSQVLCETDANGAISAYYVYGLGLAYKVDPDSKHYYYHFDPLGSTIAMTDDANNVVNSYAYDPFGKVTNSVESTPNAFKFVGQYGVMLETNGLIFMRARYYLPEFARFLTKDPARVNFTDTQNLNAYVYAAGNPVILTDASGLDWINATLNFTKALTKNALQSLLGEAQQQALRSIINRHGFDALGEAAFKNYKAVPLIGASVGLGVDAYNIWNTPNMDWTEKLGRISLKTSDAAIGELVGLIPGGGKVLQPFAGAGLDASFESRINLFKEVGDGVSGWFMSDDVPVQLDQEAIRRQHNRTLSQQKQLSPRGSQPNPVGRAKKN